ncbi:hypothetical protein [Streptomyces sp. NPDC101178]|uniref:hypothetical protein n=1 Tax=Streptomyces sp. NPDC101178 TaxID=3366124 RepID=UPI0038043DED
MSTAERHADGSGEQVGALVARASQQISDRPGRRPAPEQTIDSVKADLAEVKEKAHR